MHFKTNYDGEDNCWKEMQLDEELIAFRYNLQVEHSGAYYFVTSFHPSNSGLSFMYRVDSENIDQHREGPIIRFVVQNKVFLFSVEHL